ncbi:MAG: hypothetical protein JW818_16675 [Pirellulales bacterium]|nr:hypothetical protein [Pirellulales bacterium]
MKKLLCVLLLVFAAAACGTAQQDIASPGTASEEPAAAEADTVQPDADVSPLAELEWMVGQWVDQGEDATIEATCSWTKNRKFLTRSFSVLIDGKATLEGTQVIGWDPAAKQIRSWTFDSEGGFGEAHWIRDGNRWLAKTSFVLADGKRASAVNVFTYVDENTLRWQSTAREVGGELQPNIPEVTVVRRKATDNEQETTDPAEVKP